MFTELSAKKFTLIIVSVFVMLCVIVQFPVEAGRTEYDKKVWSITVKGCDGEVCKRTNGVARVTVQNTHWTDFHGTPPNKDISEHDDDHDSEERNVIYSSKTTYKKLKCDGTACPKTGSGSGDDD